MSPAASERRRWPRIPGPRLGHLSASFVNGPDVTLANLSRSGALIEVSARYAMKAFVRLKLVRSPDTVTIAAGTVLWSKVNAIVNGQVSYLMAVAFESPILDMEAATGISENAAADPVVAPAAVPPAMPDVVELVAPPDEQPVAQVKVEPARPDAEQPRLVLELTAAVARAEALNLALETREQEHQKALREQHDRYQAIIGEMVKASTEQQADMARQRDTAEYQRADLESRIDSLVAQVQVLELRNAAHEGRQRALRQDVEHLLSALAAPADAPASRQEAVPAPPAPTPLGPTPAARALA